MKQQLTKIVVETCEYILRAGSRGLMPKTMQDIPPLFCLNRAEKVENGLQKFIK